MFLLFFFEILCSHSRSHPHKETKKIATKKKTVSTIKYCKSWYMHYQIVQKKKRPRPFQGVVLTTNGDHGGSGLIGGSQLVNELDPLLVG